MRARRTGRHLSLRTRLIVALLVLATAGLGAFGVASVLLIKKSQLSRVDAQLGDFGRTVARGAFRPPRTTTDTQRAEVPTPANLPTDFRLFGFAADGTQVFVRGQSAEDVAGPVLPAINDSTLTALSAGPFTVDDRAGGSGWRVRVFGTSDGITAVALSLASSDATVRQVLTIEFAVGGAVLVVLAGVGFVVVRVGLRPLTRMEDTAQAIAAGDIDRRVSDTDPRTETGRLGAALNTMVARLGAALRQRQRSEGRLRRFVADASHELRTPLTSIRGFAELYRRGGAVEPGDVDRLMGRIEDEATRMGLLVDDLLLLARLDEERALDLTDVDLIVLAADAVHDVSAREPDRQVGLSVPGVPVRVMGDENRLRQVMANLVTNAITHTPSGTPVKVTVGAAIGPPPTRPAATAGPEFDTARPHALVEVHDDGDGIPVEAAPMIFDRFFRVDAARSRKRGGNGLGLAIVAAILEAHGGRVELETAAGRGSTFRIRLPLL